MKEVYLPEWAKDIGVEGFLLVPEQYISDTTEPSLHWKSTDWLNTCFWYLIGFAEATNISVISSFS